MSKRLAVLTIIFIACATACVKEESKTYTFTGKAQKGPLVTGTNITLHELNDKLGQTGRNFTTTITTDDGSFNLNNIELETKYALLTANGYYYHEILGGLSSAPLTLQGIADVSNKNTLNINTLTHIIKARVEKLVAEGKTFKDANNQAKEEILTFLNVSETFPNDFSEWDISQDEEYNAVLLAFSLMLQRRSMIWNEIPSLTAELTRLMTNIGSDLSDDGTISNQSSIDTILYNISQLDLIDLRLNIEGMYQNLGITANIPDFENYLAKFQEKHASILYTDFYYPELAPPEPVMSPGSNLPNILNPNLTELQQHTAYAIAAYTPLYSTLTIKFKSENSGYNYQVGGPMHGWEYIYNPDSNDGFTLNSQRQNCLMTMLIHLQASGTATIEYYENGEEVPSFTKVISW